MSLRKAKLLLEQKKKIQQMPETQQNQSEEEQETLPQNKNTFATFGNEASSEEEEKPKEEKQKKEEKAEKEEKGEKKKKNKKKKKKKNDQKIVEKNQNSEEQMEKIMKEVGWEAKKQQKADEINEQEWERILRISQAKFNYEKQLKRHFSGWQEQRANEDPEMTKKQQKYQKHLKKMMKKSVLSPGVKDFFLIREKFDIEREEDKVRFVPTKKYEHYQVQYEAIRNSNDINALFAFTQTHPEHVDSLYGVGEFLRLQGNYRDADNLIQRVIYIYEFAGGYDLQEFIKFDIIKKQIQYDNFSKSLFMSIFKMMDILGKKGCFRAALEYNKFLLKINIADPTACLLSMDFNAISAKSYEYLIKFIKYFSFMIGKKETSLYFLPNFTFSIALAKFHLENQSKAKQQLLIEENNLNNLLKFNEENWQAALHAPTEHNFDMEDPRVLILRAIMVYPKLIVEIANKNDYSKQFLNHSSFQGNQKKTFKQILNHDFWKIIPDSYAYHFLRLQSEGDSKGLDKVLEVYVERSKILWKSNQVMLWVKGAMGFVLNQIDGQQFKYQEYLESLCLEEGGGIPVPFNLRRYEHISKANFSDRVDQIDLANIQDNQQQQQPQGNPINVEGGNPFGLFLQSLLPWVNLPENQNYDPDMPDIQEDD